jgi:hypothetical protein
MTDVRRRAVRAAFTAAAAGLLLAGAATATAAAPAEGPRPAAAAVSGDVSVFGGLEVKVVEPYEAVAISEEWHMGLLPQGEQNYVVSHPDQFAANVEAAKQYAGDSIRPDSISLGVRFEDGDVQLITGAWRLAEAPSTITVTFEGDSFGYAAQIVQLPGRPGWGTYYFDAAGWGLSESAFTVQAVDQDGDFFDTMKYEPWLQD